MNTSDTAVSPPAIVANVQPRPACSISGPTARRPSGPAIVAIVITAVITFGRSAGGVRVVSSPKNGELTSGFESAEITSATSMAPSETSRVKTQMGSAIPKTATDASFSGSTFVTSLNAAIV